MYRYIILKFLEIFLIIFSIIVFITSIIFIITISNITSKFYITFFDLVEFFLLFLPKIFLFTLSISFFISAISVFAKFSENYELIVSFALGFKPSKLLKPLFFIAIFITITNLIFLFKIIPIAEIKFLYKKNLKQKEFNLNSNKITQKFKDWIIFAKREKNSISNIYLYSLKKNEFIISNEAKIDSNFFILKKGKLYDLNKSVYMKFDTIKFPYTVFFKIDKKKKEIIKYFPIALLPVALFFFIPILSFFHPRIKRTNYLLYGIGILGVYIALALINTTIYGAIILPITFIILSRLIQWKK